VRRFTTRTEELQDKLNVVQNGIFKSNEAMDQFKLQMNWNQVGATSSKGHRGPQP
jgi:hypothetical protein